MSEEQKKKNSMDVESPSDMYSVLVCHARGKGIFVAENARDGCWRNYIMRGLRSCPCEES